MELVVDANILISGLLKDGATRELMLNNALCLFSPEFVYKEFLNHLGELAKKAGMNEKDLKDFTQILILESDIKIMKKEETKKFINLADKISPDPDDAQYFSAALQLNCPIWSNDKKLKNQKHVKVYSTTDLLKILK